jgi:hypothetical protein
MKINLKYLPILLSFALFYSLNVHRVTAQTQTVNKYNDFIVIPSIWKSYRVEEIPRPLPVNGQVLCINKKSLESRLINGSLKLKEVEHFLGGKGFDTEIKACNAREMPLFFMTSIKSIKNGNVKTNFLNKDIDNPDNKINNFDNLVLKFNNKIYKLTRTRIGSYSNAECKFKIELSVNNQKQTIIERNIFDTYQVSGHPTLIWAGDLDNDGKLDLIIRYMNYQYDIAYSLFLSSFADKDKLVKLMKKTVYWTD